MKRGAIIAIFIIGLIMLSFKLRPVKQAISAVIIKSTLVNTSGLTVKDRVKIPEHFKRVVYSQESFQEYVRNYTLKAFGAKVINYTGRPYFYQSGHIGILDIPVPKNGLQQCADALIRIRSEYLWDTNNKGDIGFNFTSGHYCSWQKYAEGYRPKIDGNTVSFHKTRKRDHSKSNFYNYLNLIYAYSGTLSLNSELGEITSIENLKIGDMLIVGGSPGHVVMIADVIENETGEKRFLLMQGNTPAQSVHLLKNLDNTTMTPWYELKLNSEITIPGYTFAQSKFVRFK